MNYYIIQIIQLTIPYILEQGNVEYYLRYKNNIGVHIIIGKCILRQR